MNKLLIVMLFTLTSCTTPTVRDTSLINNQNCETVDCIIDLMDTLPPNKEEERYPFMEGYPDTNLRKLKNSGKLTIAIMNPLLLGLGMYGWAYIEQGKYGQVDTCDVHYVPGFNWFSLKHELSHCQGYADHGIPLQIATYTEAQQEIMDKEGVSRWIDTKYYKEINKDK